MKIVHACLSCFYIDGGRYQENELVRAHVQAGHEVVVVASTENHASSGALLYSEPGEYVGSDGARVNRLPYRRMPHRIARKVRLHPRVQRVLAEERPDVVMFHGLCGFELLTVARWCAREGVDLWVDSHEDAYNSARTMVSREVLHRRYYATIIRFARRYISNPILCVSLETMDFAAEMYGFGSSQLKFFPLGGHPVEGEEYSHRRTVARAALGIEEQHTLLVQSGKMTSRKRVIETLEAFHKTEDPSLQLRLAGTFAPDIEGQAQALVQADSRISALGWLDGDRLVDLLIAADVYLQPGTQSVTMQQSLCCRCAVVLDGVPSHDPYVDSNGWLLGDSFGLPDAFAAVIGAKPSLAAMGARSGEIAQELLDYKKLARVITGE